MDGNLIDRGELMTASVATAMSARAVPASRVVA